MTLTENGALRLAQAIVVSGADVYRHGLKNRNAKNMKKQLDAEEEILESKAFFNSQWYEMLTTIDRRYLMGRIEREARK